MKKFESILIIDGDPICNYMTLNFFNKYKVSERLYFCKNGREALRYMDLNKLTPELIFLELYTPVMSGFEFLEEIQERGIDTTQRIIFYTTHTQDVFHKYNYRVIDKPLTFEKFSRVVNMTVNS